MGLYNIYQWLIFFYIYCFLGWCIESTIVSVESKKMINRGFLSGPLLPIYGLGAVLVLFITLPFRGNLLAVYFVGMIGATILEYFTGWLMETIFKVKYWDYSYYKIQYKGRICLVCSLFWGVLSILLIQFVHKPIERYVLLLDDRFVMIISIVVTLFVIADTITSIKATIDINKLMEKSEKALSEIKELKSEIELILNNASNQLYYIKDSNEGDISEFSNKIKTSVDTLKDKIEGLSNGIRKEVAKLSFIKERLVQGYPTAYSTKFNYKFRNFKEEILKKHSNEDVEIENRKNLILQKLEEIRKKYN